MNRIIIFFSCLVLFSCSAQRKLNKSYVGKPETVLSAKFGNPKTVLDRESGKVYIFEKETTLKSTEISQAKLTLDPIVSPSVKKTERYYFTINEGIITKVKLEEEYER